MNPRILIFDVETTGLFPNKRDKYVTLDKYPYIIQLSFVIYNLSTREIEQTYNNYIRIPNNVFIPEEVIKITGITNEICKKNGVDILDALVQLHDAYMLCGIIVAHNEEFDRQMVKVELQRNFSRIKTFVPYCLRIFDNDYETVARVNTYCTMKHGVKLCNIMVSSIGVSGELTRPRIKWPRLGELYNHLFLETPENLHNSMVDVLVCLRCYLKMRHDIVLEKHEFSDWLKCYC